MSLDFSQRPKDLNAFFTKMRPYVFAFAYRVCGRVDEAEDMVQNSMVEGFMQYSEDAALIPRPAWFLQLVYQEMKNNRDYDLSPSDDDETLIEPILTPKEFWAPLQDPGLNFARAKVLLEDSLQIGLLTLLQKLEFNERAVFVLTDILGFALPEVQTILGEGAPMDAIEKYQKAANEFLETYYFSRDPKKMLWRPDPKNSENLAPWMDAYNQKNEGQFSRLTDSGFRCLISFSPLILKENFLDEMVEKTPIATELDFDLNGQRAIGFGDRRHIHTLAVALNSAKGVATLLGYDVKDLPTKIRSRFESDEIDGF